MISFKKMSTIYVNVVMCTQMQTTSVGPRPPRLKYLLWDFPLFDYRSLKLLKFAVSWTVETQIWKNKVLLQQRKDYVSEDHSGPLAFTTLLTYLEKKQQQSSQQWVVLL